jgi:hypothetical protein
MGAGERTGALPIVALGAGKGNGDSRPPQSPRRSRRSRFTTSIHQM